jgi:N-acetylglucosaminyl-diphospho-decaprenol L-rhamnosyltransferase
MTSIAVVTVVAGRHQHLRAQHAALSESHRRPDHVVVASMGDAEVAQVVDDGPLRDVTTVVRVEPEDAPLPLARARNAGARTALAAGADLLVFLDVDCLPTTSLVDHYRRAHAMKQGNHLFCGPVAYLPPLPPDATTYDPAVLAAAVPHPARPAPPPGTLQHAGDRRLFWSLSFAVGRAGWSAVGGFDEAYVGYGAEDTDFAERARRADVTMWWVGGAVARHQWHPVSSPPVEHLHDIVRNANLFHERWGWFPMAGWLDAFARAGLAEHDRGSWVVRQPDRARVKGARRLS